MYIEIPCSVVVREIKNYTSETKYIHKQVVEWGLLLLLLKQQKGLIMYGILKFLTISVI